MSNKKVKPKKVDELQLKDVTEKAKQLLDEQKRVAEQMIKDLQELLLSDTKYNQEQFFNKVNSIKEPLKKIEEPVELPKRRVAPKQTQTTKRQTSGVVKQSNTEIRSTKKVEPVKDTESVKKVLPIKKDGPVAKDTTKVVKQTIAKPLVKKQVKKQTTLQVQKPKIKPTVKREEPKQDTIKNSTNYNPLNLLGQDKMLYDSVMNNALNKALKTKQTVTNKKVIKQQPVADNTNPKMISSNVRKISPGHTGDNMEAKGGFSLQNVKNTIKSVQKGISAVLKKIHDNNPFQTGSSAYDAYDIVTNGMSLKQKYELARNGIKRSLLKKNANSDTTASLLKLIKQYKTKTKPETKSEPYDTTAIDQSLVKANYQSSDTIHYGNLANNRESGRTKFDGRDRSNRYILSEDLDLTDLRFGSVNREKDSHGNTLRKNKTIDSESGLITLYQKALKKSDYRKGSSYREHDADFGTWGLRFDDKDTTNFFIGYNKEGKIKIGNFKDFKDDDVVSPIQRHIYKSTVLQNGKPKITQAGSDSSRGAYMYNDASGSLKKFSIASGRSKDGNIAHSNMDSYGFVAGGGYVIRCGKELRLVRGSANLVRSAIDRVQKNHKGRDVELFEIDNGSFANDLRTYNGKFTPDDIYNYLMLNTNGGHFMYVKPRRIKPNKK